MCSLYTVGAAHTSGKAGPVKRTPWWLRMMEQVVLFGTRVSFGFGTRVNCGDGGAWRE